MSDFTTFRYITEMPEIIDADAWFELALRAYNMGLTLFWFIICAWSLDLIFTAFGKMHSKGRS